MSVNLKSVQYLKFFFTLFVYFLCDMAVFSHNSWNLFKKVLFSIKWNLKLPTWPLLKPFYNLRCYLTFMTKVRQFTLYTVCCINTFFLSFSLSLTHTHTHTQTHTQTHTLTHTHTQKHTLTHTHTHTLTHTHTHTHFTVVLY